MKTITFTALSLLGSALIAQEKPEPPPGGPELRGPQARDPGERPMRRAMGPPPDGERGFDRPEGMEAPMPQRPMRPTPYLGLVTSPAPAALVAQLGLAEGFGLVVDEVADESPAKTAGIERHDLLKELNDQQLTDPNQLTVLVRKLGKDAEATLTLLRKGQEQKVTVKIGEKMMPRRERIDPRSLPELRESIGRRLDQPGGERDGPAGVRPADLLREMHPGAAPQGRGDFRDGASRWEAGRGRVTMRDRDGELEVVGRDGHRTLTVRDAKGDTVFTGPLDTPEQRSAVPAPYRAKLQTLDGAPDSARRQPEPQRERPREVQ